MPSSRTCLASWPAWSRVAARRPATAHLGTAKGCGGIGRARDLQQTGPDPVCSISQVAGDNTSYFIYDGLGSTANLTSSTGAAQWTWSYEPFGSIRTETKASGNQPDNFMKFTGEYLDPTGLYHLRARQYDATSGRFLQVDPAHAIQRIPSSSTYAYAAANPTVFVDPSGMTFRPAAQGWLAAWIATSRKTLPGISVPPNKTGTESLQEFRPADGGGGGFGGASPNCRVRKFGLPEFFSIQDNGFVRGKVLIEGCRGVREPIIDVCVALKNPKRGGGLQNVLLALSCAGYLGHPDGWIYSYTEECYRGRLYASAFAYDKTKNRVQVSNKSVSSPTCGVRGEP